MLLILVSIFCVLLNGTTAFRISNETTSYANTPVRLVNGRYNWEGRVEVYHGGQWGSICDDNFDRQDAQVICSMLGYGRYGSDVNHAFGTGSGSIMLDELDCTGYEHDITQCKSNSWYVNDCSHSEDIGVTCNPGRSTTRYRSTTYRYGRKETTSYANTPIRLVSGRHYWEGRVEVYYYGQWGTICDDKFDQREAEVICSMLGFSRYGSHVSQFEEGSGNIMLDELDCTGYEHDIAQCKSDGWVVNDCSNVEDAGVICNPGSSTTRYRSSTDRYGSSSTNAPYVTLGRKGHIPIRLTAGNRGLLMLYYNGSWGYVCAGTTHMNFQFDPVCRYLGYTVAYSVSRKHQNLTAIVTDFYCYGMSYNNGVDDCSGRNFGGNNHCNYKLYIECDSLTTVESVTMPSYSRESSVSFINIRLVGGNYKWEGRVEIYHNGVWGTICDDDFGTKEAQILCKMLGYNGYGNVTAYGNAAFGQGYGPIMLDNLDCNGYESDISQCYSNGWNKHNCDHGEDASVSCRYPKSDALLGTEVTTVHSIDRATTADLLGRHDSFTTEESVTKPSYSRETSVSHTNVRLVGGNYNWEGRVEIYYKGTWGTICDDDFDTNAAKVICAMLGYNRYGNVTVYGNATFGQRYLPILFDLNCNGYESDISQCSTQGWQNHTCGHSEDVSVSCRYPKSKGEIEVSTANYFDRPTTAYILGQYGNHGHLLFNLSKGSNGFLQIYHNGRWNHVCHSHYQYTNQFHSLCRYLGYFYAYRAYGQYDSLHSAIVTDFHCPPSNTYYYDPSHGIDDCTGIGFGKKNYCYEKLYIECGLEVSTVGYEVTTNPLLGSHDSVTTEETATVPFKTDALSHACSNMFINFNGDRSNATNCLVLLTDGQSQAQQEADRCKARETKIISVGIGDSIDEQVLRNLAYNYDYYLSTNYSDIAGFLPKLVTTAVNCGGLESVNAKHIIVNCQHSSWYVKVHLPPMEQQYSDFKETDIYLGIHSCTGTKIGDYLIFHEDYTTCGTYKIVSANGVIYTNTLVYAVHDPNQPYIVHEYRFRVSVECDMSKGESGENNTNIIHGNLEQQTISGVGRFDVQLKFFSDSNFQHEFNGFPPSYMVGQNVYVKATTPIHDYNVKMRLSDCYTKPSKSASDSYIYYLIQNGCSAEPSAFITTKSTHETRFHFQDFEYAFHPHSMYVHCNATFCHSNDYSRDCEPRCSNRKRVGGIDQEDELIEGVGPIGYAEDEATVLFQKGPKALNAGQKPEVKNKGSKPVYVVGVVVVALSMIAILVVMSVYFRSKRRAKGQSKIV